MLQSPPHQAEALPSYLARQSRKLLFHTSKKADAEKARQTRELHNLNQPIFQLPAELRNQIYAQLLPTNREIKRSLHHRSQGRIPALLQVCRFLRHETYPLFFATNLVVITLQHLTQHIRATQRLQSCLNLLPDSGTREWRMIRLETCSRCFHSDGFAVLANIDVLIDRGEGTVTCQPRASLYLRPCCRSAQKDLCVRLTAEIEASGFQDARKKLRRDDLERLAIKMDEFKWDWPRSPRRAAVPQRVWKGC